MLETIVAVTFITLAIVVSVVALAIHKVKNEFKEDKYKEEQHVWEH